MQTLQLIGIPAAFSTVLMLGLIITNWTTWSSTPQASYEDDSAWRW